MEQALTIYQFDSEYYLNRYEFLNKVQNKVLEFFTEINKDDDFTFEGTTGEYTNEISLGKVSLPLDRICILKYKDGQVNTIECDPDQVQVKLSIVINEKIIGFE